MCVFGGGSISPYTPTHATHMRLLQYEEESNIQFPLKVGMYIPDFLQTSIHVAKSIKYSDLKHVLDWFKGQRTKYR